MTLALLSLLLFAQDVGKPVELHDGGFCAGLSWVSLTSGETVTVEYGPDFNVFHVKGPADRWWGIYSGNFGQSRPDRAHPLLAKDGAVVFRGTGDDASDKGHFNGYFVGDGRGQNHFFGNVFKDAVPDRAFFQRIRLGKTAERLCAQMPQKDRE